MPGFPKAFAVLILLSAFFAQAPAEETLTWQDCVREAAKNNPDLIVSMESVKQAEAEKDITKSALFPQVTSSAGISTSKVSGSGSSNTYDYGVSATQLIFDGTKTISQVRAASETIKASQQGYRFTSTDVRLQLRHAFVGVLRAQEMLKVAQDIFSIRRSNLELIALRYESGLEHKGALLNAEADLARAQLDIDEADRNLQVVRSQLSKALGRGKAFEITVRGDFEVTVEDKKPDLEAIVKNNPQVLQAEFQKKSAAYSLRAAYAAFFPEISGSADIGKTYSTWPPKNTSWGTGLSLSWPIFEGGLRTAQVAQAKSLLRQYEAQQISVYDSAVYSLEQAWAALKDAIQAAQVEARYLEAYEERSKIAEAQYSLGLMQFDNWTIIQNDLVNAKKGLLNAQANAMAAEADWVKAKGEVLEYAQTQ